MDRQAGPAFPRGLGTKTHGHAAVRSGRREHRISQLPLLGAAPPQDASYPRARNQH